MPYVVDLLLAHQATAWTALVVLLLLLFWAYVAWLKQRNLTAMCTAAIEGKDEEGRKTAAHLAEKMIDADTKCRRWYWFGRDHPPGEPRP